MPAHAVFYRKFESKNTRYFLGILACILLVGANILASQRYDEHMYGYMDGKKEDTLTYLKHIWGTPLFAVEMRAFEDEKNLVILQEWKKIQRQNAQRIATMEKITQSHPYSPELYYNLHLLYSENGNIQKANENLNKARQIDPSI